MREGEEGNPGGGHGVVMVLLQGAALRPGAGCRAPRGQAWCDAYMDKRCLVPPMGLKGTTPLSLALNCGQEQWSEIRAVRFRALLMSGRRMQQKRVPPGRPGSQTGLWVRSTQVGQSVRPHLCLLHGVGNPLAAGLAQGAVCSALQGCRGRAEGATLRCRGVAKAGCVEVQDRGGGAGGA